MTKHKHCEMIKAWADNDELVAFCKNKFNWVAMKKPVWNQDSSYFLCLPQHKEACLHWLNGGSIMVNNGKSEMESEYSLDVVNHPFAWTDFLHDEYKFRIKPRKQKRWIGVHEASHQTTPTIATKTLCEDYVLRHCVLGGSPFCDWQFIEIEIEI